MKPYPDGTVYYRYKGQTFIGTMPRGPYTSQVLFNVEGDGTRGLPWRPVPGIQIEPRKAVNAKYKLKERAMIDNVRYKK